jgi:hypothetical protein
MKIEDMGVYRTGKSENAGTEVNEDAICELRRRVRADMPRASASVRVITPPFSRA